MLATLRAGAVPDERAVHAYLNLISNVNGFTMDETGEGGQPPAGQPPPEQIAQMVRDYLASLPPDQFPNLVAVADHFVITDQDHHRFEALIDLYVEGLARRAAPDTARSQTPTRA